MSTERRNKNRGYLQWLVWLDAVDQLASSPLLTISRLQNHEPEAR